MSGLKFGGKAPLSEKGKKANFIEEDVFGNMLYLPKDFRDHLASKKLECYFIDAKQLSEHGGYHENGWVPYLMEDEDYAKLGNGAAVYGRSPDKVLRRGTVILGVRSIELGDYHRTKLAQRVIRQTQAASGSDAANELKHQRRGLDIGVIEGYEDEE